MRSCGKEAEKETRHNETAGSAWSQQRQYLVESGLGMGTFDFIGRRFADYLPLDRGRIAQGGADSGHGSASVKRPVLTAHSTNSSTDKIETCFCDLRPHASRNEQRHRYPQSFVDAVRVAEF